MKFAVILHLYQSRFVEGTYVQFTCLVRSLVQCMTHVMSKHTNVGRGSVAVRTADSQSSELGLLLPFQSFSPHFVTVFLANSLAAVIAAWLNASHRRRWNKIVGRGNCYTL